MAAFLLSTPMPPSRQAHRPIAQEDDQDGTELSSYGKAEFDPSSLKVDHANARYPYCVVWTPIPLIT